MIVLIGNGPHARDIAHHLHDTYRIFTHHSKYMPDMSDTVIIGINDPHIRAEVADELDVTDEPWVHPATILCGVTYGPGTHINYGAHAIRTRIGCHTTISPGATICGDVVIGDRVLVGANATICDRVTIGHDAVVGAGCVVLPGFHIPASTTWVGNPARQVR